MSKHAVLRCSEKAQYLYRLTIWHDEDGEDNPVIDMEYGNALLEYGRNFFEATKQDVRWADMSRFNVEFESMPALSMAIMCRDGLHLMQTCVDDPDSVVSVSKFNPSAMFYGFAYNGNDNDGRMTSFQNKTCLKYWLDSLVEPHKFISWLCNSDKV